MPDIVERLRAAPLQHWKEAAAEIIQLRELLGAARICLKSRDRSGWEAKVYAAICDALEPKP